nr:immunoglobulin heavy chain junction region [Mus musculus]
CARRGEVYDGYYDYW